MNKISNTKELKLAIAALEAKRSDEGRVVKEQFLNIQAQLQPLNVLKNTVKGFMTSTELKNSILDLSMGASAGYLIKSMFNGESKSVFKRLVSIATQSLVSAEVVKKGGQLRKWFSSLAKK